MSCASNEAIRQVWHIGRDTLVVIKIKKIYADSKNHFRKSTSRRGHLCRYWRDQSPSGSRPPQWGSTDKQSVSTPKSGSDGKIVSEEIIRLIRKIDRSEKSHLLPISISSAGPLDLTQGIIAHCPNIPLGQVPLVKPRSSVQASGFTLQGYPRRRTRREFFGNGQDIANLVYVTISTGIGGGAIINNRLLIGRNGNATEIGRFIVSDDPYHWNTCASGQNLPRIFALFCKQRGLSYNLAHVTAKDIFESARKQEPAAFQFLEELGRINGNGLSSLIVAYEPERVIFGGSVLT